MSGGQTDTRARPAGLSAAGIVVGIAILLASFLAGRYAGFLNSKPAFFARIDVLVVLGAAILAGLVVAYMVGRVTRARPHLFGGIPRPRLAVVGLVVAGLVAGGGTAGATGARYREPTVLVAVAKAAGQLSDVPGFVAAGDMPATCRSVPDGVTVSEVIANDLGSIDGFTLRAGLTIPEAPITFQGDVFIDGGDLPPDTMQPFWAGTMTIAELAPDGRSGLLTFDALELIVDPPLGPKPDGTTWPATLAGSIRWACEAFPAPAG